MILECAFPKHNKLSNTALIGEIELIASERNYFWNYERSSLIASMRESGLTIGVRRRKKTDVIVEIPYQ